MQETKEIQVPSREDSLEDAWQPTPVFLPGESMVRSLAGCSPWGHKELDATE